MAHVRGSSDDRRQRQTPADTLADRHQVGNDAPVLRRPHPTGPPEAGLDLVEDQRDPVRIREVAKAGEEPIRWPDDPTVALDGLDDDRRERPDPRPGIL